MWKGEADEDKITYQDGEVTRAIRGTITHEDDFFIYLARRQGDIRINKNQIIKIEKQGRRY